MNDKGDYMKKIFFGVVSFFIMMINANAACDDEEMIRLSKLANNVASNYYFDPETQKFEITFTNVTKEIVITDLINGQMYNEDIEFTIKNLESGNYRFNITSTDVSCTGETLVTKYINLPYYNKFYTSEECKGIENYSYCKKWVKNEISESIFQKKVTQYKENLNKEIKQEVIEETVLDKIKKVILDIYVNYYYIILPLFITILCIIIYIKDKSDDIL